MEDSSNNLKRVRARVPASIANLGPGFDVHSIALRMPEIQLELSIDRPGIRKIETSGKFAETANSDPAVNAAGKALDAIFNEFGISVGYALRIMVNIPPRKGLGLSGAEAVGAVLCANRMFGLGLRKMDIVRRAAIAEPSHHMDNVSAAALGGFNIVSHVPLRELPEVMTAPPPRDLGVAVIVPDIEKPSTEAARQVLPTSVPLPNVVQSLSYASRISAAFLSGDVDAILETLPWDPIVEPARAEAGAYGRGVTAEFLKEEKRLLLERYHVAETISGAGPSRALWYRLSEDMKMRRKRTGLIRPAVDQVSRRLETLGYSVHHVFLTVPSPIGGTVIRERSRRLQKN